MSRFDRCVLLVFGLNALDVVLTIVLTSYMKLTELNPVMESLLSRSPVAFSIAKLAAVGAVCGYLRKWREDEPAMTDVTTGIVVGMLIMICSWQAWMVFLTYSLF